MVLEGEAGVGKARLAYAALQHATQLGATVISATCQVLEQKLPFAALADSIGRYLRTLPDAVLTQLPGATLAILAQIVPSLQDRLLDPETGVLDGALSVDENRHRLIDAIAGLLVDLSRLRPLLLFLDDLHWADTDTLAVISRLSQQLGDVPIFVLLAFRSDDMVENDALVKLLYGLNRGNLHQTIEVHRLTQGQVAELIDRFTGEPSSGSEELAGFLYEATQGNALFVTEALRDLQERFSAASEEERDNVNEDWLHIYRHVLTLRSNQRVNEIILERVDRLPEHAYKVLQLGAVIGRDFSLDLLEASSEEDPLDALDVLLQRQFFMERADQRLDFSHQVVRQTVYDNMNTLLRRRLHRRVADALVALQQQDRNAAEIAFHYGAAGSSSQLNFARYSVLAGEKLLQSFGLRQSIEHFNNALAILEGSSAEESDLMRRALQGRGLAYESLLDPDGVTETYRRLMQWARRRGDLELMLTVHSRLAFMLELLGQQRESNGLLRELLDVFAEQDVSLQSAAINDLLERRRTIFAPYAPVDRAEWSEFVQPPPAPARPVEDILAALEPVHAVVPLMTYGWTLRVQGQLTTATACLTKAVELAEETGQRALASIAYFQLAVMARMQGDAARSQTLNEQSRLLNQGSENNARVGEHVAAHRQRLPIAPRGACGTGGTAPAPGAQLLGHERCVPQPPQQRGHRPGPGGAGIRRLRAGADVAGASLADPINLYPYTHVQGLLGLANLADRLGDTERCCALLRQALRFAGQRSLIEEYVEVVEEIVRLNPPEAPTVCCCARRWRVWTQPAWRPPPDSSAPPWMRSPCRMWRLRRVGA
ncbi:MAG: AAA family ATPase [Caldilineaceae bacterium]